jgi:type II secretory pathway predicted ATPase ExeA
MPGPFERSGRPEHSSSSGFLTPVPVDSRPSGLTYEPFYGLKEKPFSLTSDAHFFYQSRSHAPAFDDLLNAIRRRESLNVLTGDIGTGKTTLCRAVLESLDRKTFSAFVPDPFASREELLKVLLADFGVASADDVTSGRLRNATRTELSYRLSEFLRTLVPLQAFAVVIIDEAQNLSQQLLEEVRILSDADGQLQVVLVGQLELRARLKQSEMRQLDQRVSVHCQLQPLDTAGVAGYISHRLHVAGGSSDRVRFTGEAVEAIYLLSGGVPRVINRICDRALRYGYSKKEATIDADIVTDANPGLANDTASPPLQASLPAPAPVPAVATAPATTFAPAPVTQPISDLMPESELLDEPVNPPSELPEQVESWLQEIDGLPSVDLDWRQRWAATNAVAPPAPERRSGIRLRFQAAAPNPIRQVERNRWRLAIAAVAIVIVLVGGAASFGPWLSGAASGLRTWIDEVTTPPSEQVLLPSPKPALPAPPQVTPPIDLDLSTALSRVSPRR